jgi:predicted DNA-binding transcriptional regulator YafY
MADMLKSSRSVEMFKLREKGWLIRELAARFNISDRTVYRSLRLFKTADVKGARHAG